MLKGKKTDISSRYFSFNLQNMLTYNFKSSITSTLQHYRKHTELRKDMVLLEVVL